MTTVDKVLKLMTVVLRNFECLTCSNYQKGVLLGGTHEYWRILGDIVAGMSK
jgi:hypothetical protein